MNDDELKIAIVGSRTIKNKKTIKDLIHNTLVNENIHTRNIVLVSGGAVGVDSIAEEYAEEKNIPIEVYRPDYKKYGKKGPFIRNEKIAKECSIAIVFWDGFSGGTAHVLTMFKKYGKTVILYTFDLHREKLDELNNK